MPLRGLPLEKNMFKGQQMCIQSSKNKHSFIRKHDKCISKAYWPSHKACASYIAFHKSSQQNKTLKKSALKVNFMRRVHKQKA